MSVQSQVSPRVQCIGCERSVRCGLMSQLPTLVHCIEGQRSKTIMAEKRKTQLTIFDSFSRKKGMFLVLIYDCIKALYLIPCNLSKLGDTEVQSILASYRVDLPFPSELDQELRLWRRYWTESQSTPIGVRGGADCPQNKFWAGNDKNSCTE